MMFNGIFLISNSPPVHKYSVCERWVSITQILYSRRRRHTTSAEFRNTIDCSLVCFPSFNGGICNRARGDGAAVWLFVEANSGIEKAFWLVLGLRWSAYSGADVVFAIAAGVLVLNLRGINDSVSALSCMERDGAFKKGSNPVKWKTTFNHYGSTMLLYMCLVRKKT